jgi:hypothetical protein
VYADFNYSWLSFKLDPHFVLFLGKLRLPLQHLQLYVLLCFLFYFLFCFDLCVLFTHVWFSWVIRSDLINKIMHKMWFHDFLHCINWWIKIIDWLPWLHTLFAFIPWYVVISPSTLLVSRLPKRLIYLFFILSELA